MKNTQHGELHERIMHPHNDFRKALEKGSLGLKNRETL